MPLVSVFSGVLSLDRQRVGNLKRNRLVHLSKRNPVGSGNFKDESKQTDAELLYV